MLLSLIDMSDQPNSGYLVHHIEGDFEFMVSILSFNWKFHATEKRKMFLKISLIKLSKVIRLWKLSKIYFSTTNRYYNTFRHFHSKFWTILKNFNNLSLWNCFVRIPVTWIFIWNSIRHLLGLWTNKKLHSSVNSHIQLRNNL